MVATIMIALPSAVKVFNWLGTCFKGNIQYTSAMLFALAFVSLFIIGGLSGIFMAATPVDIAIHDTYFIVAHIHYVLFTSSLFGIFAAIYFWYPKMFGRMMNEFWGKVHFASSFVAANCVFFPMHILGVAGQRRRIPDITATRFEAPLLGLNQFITVSAVDAGVGAAHLRGEFLPQPVPRQTLRQQSVEQQHAGMDDDLAGPARQLRDDPHRLSLALRLRPGRGAS